MYSGRPSPSKNRYSTNSVVIVMRGQRWAKARHDEPQVAVSFDYRYLK